MDTTRKIIEGMMDAIASAEYPTEINETLLLLLTALEGARRKLSALTAERDTLKALCFDLLNELEAYCHDGECDELQDRARSILK